LFLRNPIALSPSTIASRAVSDEILLAGRVRVQCGDSDHGPDWGIFRRHDIGGSPGGLDHIVVVLHSLGVLVYPIFAHDGMPERSITRAQAQRQAIDEYVCDTPGGGSASEIGHAEQLLDEGAIRQAEFEPPKNEALAYPRNGSGQRRATGRAPPVRERASSNAVQANAPARILIRVRGQHSEIGSGERPAPPTGFPGASVIPAGVQASAATCGA
jgi:hypothetical protein